MDYNDKNQRKSPYIHFCLGCGFVDHYIPATQNGLHLNCPYAYPLRQNNIRPDKNITHEQWDSMSDFERELYKKERIKKADEYEAWRRKGLAEIQAKKEAEAAIAASQPPVPPKPVPKCPTCGSTKINKVNEVGKAASILMFGIFSKKIGKQFKCEDCGYYW